jgi:dolichol kinase
MSLSSSPGDLLFGPSYLFLILIYLGSYQFMKAESAIIAAACLGDNLAPFIGRYGRHTYCMPLSKSKTLEGSIVGVFLGTVTGIYFYLYMTKMQLVPLRLVLAYAAIASVAEGTAPG